MTSQSEVYEAPVSVMSQTHRNTLSTLSPIFNNHSSTSLISEAATFHSAQATPIVEMDQNHAVVLPCNVEPEPSSVAMSRKDSGYEAGHERRSTSTSSSRSRRPRYSTSATSSRPVNKRASRSAISSSAKRTSPRPGLQSRYAIPRGSEGQNEVQGPYEFFQFPSLSPPAPTIGASEPAMAQAPLSSSQPPIPPATIHYFLLPETRRLEYAAIDAASRGVRGFITKLLPDCILPSEFRRTKFHDSDQDSDDAGSVRRYRLRFPDPEEKGVVIEGSQWRNGSSAASAGRKPPRQSMWRRLVTLGKT